MSSPPFSSSSDSSETAGISSASLSVFLSSGAFGVGFDNCVGCVRRSGVALLLLQARLPSSMCGSKSSSVALLSQANVTLLEATEDYLDTQHSHPLLCPSFLLVNGTIRETTSSKCCYCTFIPAPILNFHMIFIGEGL